MSFINYIFISFVLFLKLVNPVIANENNLTLPLDIYEINLPQLEEYETIQKGTTLNFILKDDVSTLDNKTNSSVNLELEDNENDKLKATGSITKSTNGRRFSTPSTLQFSTNKLLLENGQEVYTSATSPLFSGAYPPHAGTSSNGLARSIAAVSLGASPVTFGASLGINFLVSGLLSACQNGISDFIWGGLNGSGLSLIERLFRKQPETYLDKGTNVPFILSEDLKISKGIHKEKIENAVVTKTEAADKIKKLIEWGDLSGALEYSAKSGQSETYNELMKKIIN